jgi:hypothetical protein
MQIFLKQHHCYCVKDKSVFKLSAKNIQALVQCRAFWTTEFFFYEQQNVNKVKRAEPSRKETVTELRCRIMPHLS